MWNFQQNIFRTSDSVYEPTVTLQNIVNTTECFETGEIFIQGGPASGTIRLKIEDTDVTGNEGTCTYSYNITPDITVHNSTSTTPVYIDVDIDVSGEAIVDYAVAADLNSDGNGQYDGTITIVDNLNVQIGVSSVRITDICTNLATVVINDEQEELDCVSCAYVTVTVPSGSSKKVTIVKTGTAPYSAGLNLCGIIGTEVGSDLSETISATKEYRFGIDMTKLPSAIHVTFIDLEVRNATTDVLEDSYRLERQHGTINC